MIGTDTTIGGLHKNRDPDIITHDQIWLAIDQLASNIGSSTSGLAKKAGLDPTSLNKSKRFTSQGRERWPSTESIAKILRTTNTPVDEFLLLGITQDPTSDDDKSVTDGQAIPMLDATAIRELSCSELKEKLTGPDKFLVETLSDKAFAIVLCHNVAGTDYAFQEIAVVEPDRDVKPNDRVILRTKDGEIHKSILVKRSQHSSTFVNCGSREELFEVATCDIEWIARIAFSA